jgi:hypothetical protein
MAGLFLGIDIGAFAEAVGTCLPQTRIGPPLLPPVAGAVLLAMNADGGRVPPEVIERLISSPLVRD